MCWGPPKRKSKNYHIRQLTKWRRERQRQRRKSMIWLVECGKIIACCTCGTLFGAIFWRSLPNDDVKFSYLSFWRQQEPAAVNLSFSAITWKPFVPIKWKDTSSILYTWTTWNNRKALNRTQSSILMWRFRCSCRRCLAERGKNVTC